MARIQVLELPAIVEGESVTTPFVVVVDRVEVVAEVQAFEGTALRHTQEPIDAVAIKAATGAVGVIVHTGTLDVA